MSLTNYTELMAGVASWLHRADLAEQIPDFIALAEARLNTDLDARAMETRVTLTATAGDAWLTLPTDVLELRRFTVVTDPVRMLQYATPDQIAADFPASLSGCPVQYAVIGGLAQLAPVPDAAYPLELTYWQRLPPIAESTSNWLLAASPGCYLYGALCEAAPWLGDDERIKVWEGKYQQAVEGVNRIDWYSGSTMRVRAR